LKKIDPPAPTTVESVERVIVTDDGEIVIVE
jgi:hypothetical protein